MKPDNGTAMIFGKDFQQILPDDLRQIGIMSDSVGFYEKMTVIDNLTFFAKFHGVELAEVEQLLKKLI